MVHWLDAIQTARSLIGTPYSEMDCIALIRAIIRQSPGGVPDYRCEGTNWLWESVNNAVRYRHLTSRQESLSVYKAGMLAFKRYGMDDEGHVGLVTDIGTIIHSSSTQGGRGVVEEPLRESDGWNLLGTHRHISVKEGDVMQEDALYMASVATQSGKLNIRDYPETGMRIAQAPKGATLEVLDDTDLAWWRVRYDGVTGYAASKYLEPVETEDEIDYDEPDVVPQATTTIVSDDGMGAFVLVGRWHVADD